MTESRLQRFDVVDEVHGAVPALALAPADAEQPLPVCIFLYGGGGSSESLADIRPLLDAWWSSGRLPALLIASIDVGPWSFYLDDPARGLHWESLVAERFVAQLRDTFAVARTPAATGLVGNSMGGYGALKIALGRPLAFGAVAAVSPMIEPACDAAEVPARNRSHYPPQVPQALLGPERDAVLYRRDHPAWRAVQNAQTLRQCELGIYLDAAGMDALHAHDGAEHLHRVLWVLDIAHEYRLRRDADHIGPDFSERLFDAFSWASTRISPQPALALTDHERAWSRCLDDPRVTAPAEPLAPTSPLFSRWLRAQLAPAYAQAALRDPTLHRRYGVLPQASYPTAD